MSRCEARALVHKGQLHLFRGEFRQAGGDHHGEQADDEAAMTSDRQERLLAQVSEPLEVLLRALKVERLQGYRLYQRKLSQI